MDADELAAVLEDPPPGLPPIRAAIPVHIYGQPATSTRCWPPAPRPASR
jgi:hypothetical protein